MVGSIVSDLGLPRAVRIHDEELLEPAEGDFEHKFLATRRRERLAHIDVSKLISERDSTALRPGRCDGHGQDQRHPKQGREANTNTHLSSLDAFAIEKLARWSRDGKLEMCKRKKPGKHLLRDRTGKKR